MTVGATPPGQDVLPALPTFGSMGAPTIILMTALLVGALIVALIVLRGAWPAVRGAKKEFGPYRSREFMSGNEIEFFGRLCRALPDCHVFPQVAMSALIEPRMNRTSHVDKAWWDVFGKISQKRVDYCVYTKPGMELLAIVELDDRTHNAQADALRDSYTRGAGIPTLRFESRTKPSVGEIRAAIVKLSRA